MLSHRTRRPARDVTATGVTADPHPVGRGGAALFPAPSTREALDLGLGTSPGLLLIHLIFLTFIMERYRLDPLDLLPQVMHYGRDVYVRFRALTSTSDGLRVDCGRCETPSLAQGDSHGSHSSCSRPMVCVNRTQRRPSQIFIGPIHRVLPLCRYHLDFVAILSMCKGGLVGMITTLHICRGRLTWSLRITDGATSTLAV